MTLKEHLAQLQQEQEAGVTLTANEATERKKKVLEAAKAEVASFVYKGLRAFNSEWSSVVEDEVIRRLDRYKKHIDNI